MRRRLPNRPAAGKARIASRPAIEPPCPACLSRDVKRLNAVMLFQRDIQLVADDQVRVGAVTRRRLTVAEGAAYDGSGQCAVCGAQEPSFHLFGCRLEYCPICRYQFPYCRCFEPKAEWPRQLAEVVVLRGETFTRLRVGGGPSHPGLDWCHDCAAGKGELHEFGCDMETCPRCGDQFAFCGCHQPVEDASPGAESGVRPRSPCDDKQLKLDL